METARSGSRSYGWRLMGLMNYLKASFQGRSRALSKRKSGVPVGLMEGRSRIQLGGS